MGSGEVLGLGGVGALGCGGWAASTGVGSVGKLVAIVGVRRSGVEVGLRGRKVTTAVCSVSGLAVDIRLVLIDESVVGVDATRGDVVPVGVLVGGVGIGEASR